MYAVTGITGQVGSAIARTLLARGQGVRAVVRDAAKGEPWRSQGAEVAVADLHDAGSLRAAFDGVDGVFAMLPPYFAPQPGYPEAREVVAALRRALEASAPPRVVALSSIGAHRGSGLGLITQLHILEQELGGLPTPIAFLRAGWFMENARWDVGPARTSGEIPSYLHPTDRPFPMVATDDIGRVAAEALLERWTGRRVVELEGPRRYSADDLARAFSAALGRDVRAVVVPRGRWESAFEAQGMAPGTAGPRIEMLEGFNSGWIEFERGTGTEPVLGRVTLDEAIARLVAEPGSAPAA
jgi:NAD(P)H dehydrogenase (quinone)